MLAFDIETGPLPEDQLRDLLPPFDEAEVKLGNLKDPEKIQAKLAEAKANHESDWISKAALSPLTGRVIAIGFRNCETGQSVVEHCDGDEAELIVKFWKKYSQCRSAPRRMVGYNVHGFDVPFMVRRSWLLGVDVPRGLIEKGKWIDSATIVDLMQLWSIGGQNWVKLDLLAKAFGLGGKTEGVDGSMFATLWESDREKAIEYLLRDVEITAELAVRMGVV